MPLYLKAEPHTTGVTRMPTVARRMAARSGSTPISPPST